MDTHRPPGVKIDQVVLLEVAFSHRVDALTLPVNTRVDDATVKLEIKYAAAPVGDSVTGVVTISSHDDERPLYRFKISMAVLVSRDAKPNMDPVEYVKSAAGPMLYPFVRETLANITSRGRFGSIWLKPFNFTMGQGEEPE